jgi:hypothetical protein
LSYGAATSEELLWVNRWQFVDLIHVYLGSPGNKILVTKHSVKIWTGH